ncbi:hypothetical protein N9514_01450 [Pseudomonadales bacterium]|nr:hypothetical protein [Pseudomonadales bacterium]MDB4068680.1 hypothetical protein [Pseudomonadales bacterium]MDB4150137.1 hypothetical protein [Pseudomonadales bacterium]
MTPFEQLTADHQQLGRLIVSQGLATDPDITPRLTALDIQLSGLAVTAARAERSAALAAMLALQIQKTSQEIYCLAHCALGYLALVDELPGTNEPLLVPAEFRRLSQLYLNPQIPALENSDDPRQYLIDLLLMNPSPMLDTANSDRIIAIQATHLEQEQKR